MSVIKTNEKKKEEGSINFTMHRKNICKCIMYMDKLEKIFNQHNLIGAKSIYNKLIDLYVLEEDELEKLSNEMIDEYTGKVISRFAKDKAYNFEIKKRVKNESYKKEFVRARKEEPKTIIRTYSGEKMIRQAVSSAVDVRLNKELKNKKKDKKEEVIQACYKSIVNYISKDKELSEIISHYKATVIAGYIAIEFGFILSADLKPINIKEAPPTNEQIYNALKYFTDPLNPANTKKKHK